METLTCPLEAFFQVAGRGRRPRRRRFCADAEQIRAEQAQGQRHGSDDEPVDDGEQNGAENRRDADRALEKTAASVSEESAQRLLGRFADEVVFLGARDLDVGEVADAQVVLVGGN